MFEGELLIELMLRYWKHPRADDSDYRNYLIETAAQVLRKSIEGNKLLEDVPPHQMNLIAAAWYAEWVNVQDESSEITETELQKRKDWLHALKQSIPSCFCDQNNLPG
jgi:hypothetical protein